MRRTLALWLLLFAVYAATLGLDAFGASDYGGDEPHYLLAAESLVEDGDVDVNDEYADARLRRLLPLRPRQARPGDRGPAERAARGRLPAADRPRLRLGGRAGVELFLAADRRAGGGAGLPAGAAGGARPVGARRRARRRAQPAVPRLRHRRLPRADRRRRARRRGAARAAARRADRRGARRSCCFAPARLAALAGHQVRAGGDRDRRRGRRAALWRAPAAHAGGRRRRARRCSAWRSTWRSTRRSTAAPPPTRPTRAGETATDASFPGGYLERAYRLVALFIDREYGLLRWAPVFLLAFVGALVALALAPRARLARGARGARRSS